MQIIPAIDILQGQCVRLRQGDYAQSTVFSTDPVNVARTWVGQGADRLHLVDLDGARAGHPVNLEVVRAIVSAIAAPCQLGGGLRTGDDLEQAFQAGVDRAILGTRALDDPEGFRGLCRQYPGRILLGLDARDGKVATHGWLETSTRSALELARAVADCPLAGIIYTDIQRDGMLAGPNIEAYRELRSAVPAAIIASGGVTNLAQIRALADLGLSGCIVGRALYEGHLELPAALACARDRSPGRSQG